jgi:hypothetical protein
LLRPGGRYGIHELGLQPDTLADEAKETIRTDLAAATKVNARPQTGSEWARALEAAGFEVVWRATAPMRLLEPRRVIDDEGLLGALRFGIRVATHPDARRRIRELRRTFDRHADRMNAVALVAEKP